jgi:hypothetical protein
LLNLVAFRAIVVPGVGFVTEKVVQAVCLPEAVKRKLLPDERF